MDINIIEYLINNPKPFSKGTHTMWTDEYISTFLLQAHLNLDSNIASRNKNNIEKIIALISNNTQYGKELLDLGCGPGLYAERLCAAGYHVTGVDFSLNSIRYANQQALSNNLNIKYIHSNYLDLDYEEKFDAIIMIYCDFCVLAPDERSRIINIIYKALKKGGCFIFDVMNENYKAIFKDKQSVFELTKGGFWSPETYLLLNQKMLYPDIQAVLEQYLVITESDDYRLYRFWNSYFTHANIEQEFKEFNKIKAYNNILSDSELGSDENVVFYCINK